jgi:hypothetical protein
MGPFDKWSREQLVDFSFLLLHVVAARFSSINVGWRAAWEGRRTNGRCLLFCVGLVSSSRGITWTQQQQHQQQHQQPMLWTTLG